MKQILLISLLIIFLMPGSSARDNKEKSRLILKVENYGVVGDGKTDDGLALRKLFEKASALNRPAKIVFQKEATYYLGKEENHQVGTMFLERANDLIVEGNNCLLLLDPHRRPFEMYRSKNITIRNFQIDYSPLPYTQGRITKIDNSKGYLEFKVDEGFPLPYVKDDSYYVDGRVSDCVTVNGENLKFYQGHSRISGITDLGDNTYAVTYRMHRQDQARIGDYFVMKVWPPEMEKLYNSSIKPSEHGEHYVANYANIQINHSQNITVENIVSYASPKMTVNARSTSDLVLRRIVITRRPGRVLACRYKRVPGFMFSISWSRVTQPLRWSRCSKSVITAMANCLFSSASKTITVLPIPRLVLSLVSMWVILILRFEATSSTLSPDIFI